MTTEVTTVASVASVDASDHLLGIRDSDGALVRYQAPAVALRGGIRYVTDGAGGYQLAAGQADDGVSCRDFYGPDDPSTAISGFVGRSGDFWGETT